MPNLHWLPSFCAVIVVRRQKSVLGRTRPNQSTGGCCCRSFRRLRRISTYAVSLLLGVTNQRQIGNIAPATATTTTTSALSPSLHVDQFCLSQQSSESGRHSASRLLVEKGQSQEGSTHQECVCVCGVTNRLRSDKNLRMQLVELRRWASMKKPNLCGFLITAAWLLAWKQLLATELPTFVGRISVCLSSSCAGLTCSRSPLIGLNRLKLILRRQKNIWAGILHRRNSGYSRDYYVKSLSRFFFQVQRSSKIPLDWIHHQLHSQPMCFWTRRHELFAVVRSVGRNTGQLKGRTECGWAGEGELSNERRR